MIDCFPAKWFSAVVALRSCQRDVTHQYKQIQNGGTETM